MKEQKLFDAVTQVSDSIIDETAKDIPKRSRPVWQKAVAIAACAAIVITGSITISKLMGNNKLTNSASAPVSEASGKYPQSSAEGNPSSNEIETSLYKQGKEAVYPSPTSIMDDSARYDISAKISDVFIGYVNNFSYKTTSALFENNNGNLNYSPLCVYYALGLLSNGAVGETKDELLKLLGDTDLNYITSQCGFLNQTNFFDNECGKTKLATSLWLKQGLDYKDKFVNTGVDKFFASTYRVDFTKQETANKMAQWVSKNTGGTITPNILPSADRVLSILSTINYVDNWATPFEAKNTKSDIFTKSNGKTVKCDYMNLQDDIGAYMKGKNFIAASKRLQNSSSMVVVLPDKGTSIESLISNEASLKSMFEWNNENSDSKIITWKMPKFNFSSKLDIADTLKKLGATTAFSSSKADFTDITEQNAYISSVTQQTQISVTEKGVAASAFTDMDMSGMGGPDEKITIKLDRPFIYGILDKEGALMFIGVCNDPTAK